jgi:LysM repeat protein
MSPLLPSSHAPDGSNASKAANGLRGEAAERQSILEFPGRGRRESHADRLRTQHARSRRPQAQPLGRGQGGANRAFERRRARRGASGASGWLQRHPLGVVYASVLVAVLSLAFTAFQVLHRAEPGSAALSASSGDEQTLNASAIPATGASLAGAPGSSASVAVAGVVSAREVQRSVKVLEPAYTIQAGDTLNRIAARFDTTVERIQAWNDLPDPRALRVGAKLVIPPPLPAGEP